MDIAGLSTALSLSKAQNDVGILMLSKALDTSQVQGQGMVEMLDSAAMERSVNPAVGGSIDYRV
ncbi:MAG: YjfB family protein [Lachnospiraceae bacterium]|nr:YjfB family protein [Lachnospiraceae bacterium]